MFTKQKWIINIFEDLPIIKASLNFIELNSRATQRALEPDLNPQLAGLLALDIEDQILLLLYMGVYLDYVSKCIATKQFVIVTSVGEATETWSRSPPFVSMQTTAFLVLLLSIAIVSSIMKWTQHTSFFINIIRKQIVFWNARSSMLKVSFKLKLNSWNILIWVPLYYIGFSVIVILRSKNIPSVYQLRFCGEVLIHPVDCKQKISNIINNLLTEGNQKRE